VTSNRTAAVVVAFNSKRPLTGLVEILLAAVDLVFVVNNGPDLSLTLNTFKNNLITISNTTNLGLAHALNQGLAAAFSYETIEMVVLFDQDSSPSAGLIRQLLARTKSAVLFGLKVAAIAPTLVDERNCDSAKEKFDQRVFETNLEGLRESETAATSGSVVPRGAYERVGPMMGELFIDGIDHEWSFRAKSFGYHCYRDESLKMLHNMGDISWVFRGRHRPIYRMPARHYFLVRNTMYLATLPYVTKSWKLREVARTLPRALAYIWFSTSRSTTFVLLFFAIRDGVTGRLGNRPGIYVKDPV
jgi:rhamnosyltransferase